ncbi:MAG: GNAT family N-acetyltransferase [Cyclobacteriaceae bacterium]
MDPSSYEVEETTLTGESLFIRPIKPEDKCLFAEAFTHLSKRSIHLRFFGAKAELSTNELIYLSELDFVNHVGLLAGLDEQGERHYVGVARYVKLTGSNLPDAAEIALTVLDDYQGKGIGTCLLKHLIKIARSQHIMSFHAEVLSENAPMLELLGETGLPMKRTISKGIALVELQLS